MNVLTIIVLAYLAFVCLRAMRRGFFKSAFSMVFLLVVIFIMIALTPSVTKLCQESTYITGYAERQTAAVIASVENGANTALPLGEARNPAEVGVAVLGIAMGANSITDAAAEDIYNVIMRCFAGVITFVLALIIGIVIQLVVSRLIKKSGVGVLDHILGIPIGLLKGMVFVWLILGLVQLLAFTSPFNMLADQIAQSPILTWITNNNLLASTLAGLVTSGI